MREFGPTFITVVGGIIGLAIVAVLVAQKAQTTSVVQGVGSALSNVITAAVSPVTGATSANTFGSTTQPSGSTTN